MGTLKAGENATTLPGLGVNPRVKGNGATLMIIDIRGMVVMVGPSKVRGGDTTTKGTRGWCDPRACNGQRAPLHLSPPTPLWFPPLPSPLPPTLSLPPPPPPPHGTPAFPPPLPCRCTSTCPCPASPSSQGPARASVLVCSAPSTDTTSRHWRLSATRSSSGAMHAGPSWWTLR